ncbi:MAG: Gfo/Idh/MocA family protein [Candidatus Hodarchaeota archaeon]
MVKTAFIIGFGGHARNSWYKALNEHPDWKLTGIIDTDTELLENIPKLAPELDEDQGYIDLQDALLHGEKPDMVVVATPIYNHHTIVKEAMDNGINVICEKNMASNIYMARQLVTAAMENPHLCTAVGNQYRFFVHFWTAHKFVNSEDNQIGKIHFVRAHESHNQGLNRRGWRRWLQDMNLEDQAIHYIDLVRYISGLDVVQVKADLFIPNFSKFQGSSTTLANLGLAKPEDYHHRREWAWCEYYSDWQRLGPNEELWEFSGDKGRFVVDPQWGVKMWLYTDDLGFKWEEDGYLPGDAGPVRGTPYTGQKVILEQMSNCIDTKGNMQPDTNFLEAFKSFATTMGALESSRLGTSVWVPKYWEDLPGYVDRLESTRMP